MRIYVLVEGDTEEKFVKSILYNAMMENGKYLQPVKFETKRLSSGKKFAGGKISFQKLEKQIKTLLKSGIVTTMIDYYGLEESFQDIMKV